MHAAALFCKASLTIPRGCTDAPSIVPRKRSTHSMNPMPFVEQDQAKDLVVQVTQARRQVFAGLLRRLQRGTATHPMRQDLPCGDEDCLTRCRDYRAIGA